MKTRYQFSAGGVVVRPKDGTYQVCLASRRTRRGDLAWGLPKGMVEPDEAPEATALREVREETGLEAEIRAPLGTISYWFVWDGERIRKKVAFFLMDAVGGDVSQHDQEMEEVRWFSLAEAPRVAAFDTEKEVLGKAAEVLAPSHGPDAT
jgi:8-oxo-dGTP pyrophosphatase MutT (NUDIX family)